MDLWNQGEFAGPTPRFSLDQTGFEPYYAGHVIGTNGFTDLCVHVPEHKPVKSFVLLTSRRDGKCRRVLFASLSFRSVARDRGDES
jgi:hypothetical protein